MAKRLTEPGPPAAIKPLLGTYADSLGTRYVGLWWAGAFGLFREGADPKNGAVQDEKQFLNSQRWQIFTKV